MKLIFLDIDGVLNNELFYSTSEYQSKKGKATTKEEFKLQQFDPRCVSLLNHITDKTKAKIVISSSWRSDPDIKDILKKVGITGEIIGVTPHLAFKSSVEYKYSVPRGCEIKAWLELNKEKLGNKMSRIKYVILDDDSDMLYWQKTNYFLVDGYSGLTSNLAYRVINFLNNIEY